MIFLGFDPGVHGGGGKIWTDDNLAILGYSAFAFDKMTEAEIASEIRPYTKVPGGILSDAVYQGDPAVPPVVLVEKQGTRTKQRQTDVARLHHQWGLMRGMLIMAKIRFEDVAPGVWQKPLRLLMTKGTTYAEKKKRHRERAQQMFPEIVVTNSNADGLLIAEYGRRMQLLGVACG